MFVKAKTAALLLLPVISQLSMVAGIPTGVSPLPTVAVTPTSSSQSSIGLAASPTSSSDSSWAATKAFLDSNAFIERYDSPSKAVNPANMTCDGLPPNDADWWTAVNGSIILRNFLEFWEDNRLLCKDCYGHQKDLCNSTSPDCTKGLHDLASPAPGSPSRIDLALQIFTNYTLPSTPTGCDIPPGNNNNQQQQVETLCDAKPDCYNFNSAGGYVLFKAMANIGRDMHSAYDQIGDASSDAQNNKQAIATLFMKDPDMPFINTTIETWTGRVQAPLVNVTQDLFSYGTSTWWSENKIPGANPPTPTTTMDITRMMPYNVPSSSTVPTTQRTKYERIILQQVALQAWKTPDSSKNVHQPFIAFDDAPCAEINEKAKNSLTQLHPVFKGTDLTLSAVDMHDGKCYYLLSAQPGKGHGKMCDGFDYLTGGTNAELAGAKGYIAGLGTPDFVVPAVNMWKKMGNANGWVDTMDDGPIVSDPRQDGMAGIPVCDFLGNVNNPGKDCPRLEQALIDGKTDCAVY